MRVEDSASAMVCGMQRSRCADSKTHLRLDGIPKMQFSKAVFDCNCLVRRFAESDQDSGLHEVDGGLQKSFAAICKPVALDRRLHPTCLQAENCISKEQRAGSVVVVRRWLNADSDAGKQLPQRFIGCVTEWFMSIVLTAAIDIAPVLTYDHE